MKKLMLVVAVSSGLFTFGDVIAPVAGDNAPAIQAAIEAAVATQGTVTLGEGLFTIDSQLMVTGGVTLVGQGYDRTVLKYTGEANKSYSRVATVNGGSTLSHLAVTGAKVSVAQNAPGAISISDGTISCCAVTNNYSYQGYGVGIGVNGSGCVRIENTVVADNTAATYFDGVGGGIGIRAEKGLRVEIDGCQVYGNRVGGSASRHGAGIGIADRNSVTTVIRGTTVFDNTATGSATLGGGLYCGQSDTTLTGCTFYGNKVATTVDYFGDANAAFPSFAVESSVAAKSSGNVFYNGSAPVPSTLPPLFGTISAIPSAQSVSFSGVIRSFGTDATTGDVYLSLAGGAAKKIVTGSMATFDCDVSGLTPSAAYSYTLTFSNNAAAVATKSGSFTTRGPNDPAQLADYTAYRKHSGLPQSVILSYYDGPDTRGFSWQTASSVSSGKVWLRKGDYTSAEDIRGKSDTVEISAVAVEHADKNCTTYKAHTDGLAEGLWSYCLGYGDKTVCGKFTVCEASGAFTAVNVNDIQTKTASKLSFWGRTIDATCAVLPSGFDFVLSGGDFIDGSSDVGADDYVQWGVVADTARSRFADTPWILACGNHESEAYDRGYAIFRELACENFFYTSNPEHDGCHAFRQGGACIITLPYYDNGANTKVPNAVESWLTQKLAEAADDNWRIVVLHAGPYTTGDHGPSATFLQQMTPIFAAGKVDLVLQAHDHTYSRTLPYRWSGAGYTTDASDSAVVNLEPATTNVAEVSGVPFYLDPQGTFYVSAGCAGHRVGEMTNYASGKDVFSFAKRTYKTVTDTVKVASRYAELGSLGSKDVGMPMFAVLKVNGGLLTYDWYVAEPDGSATLFDTLRICKSGVAELPPPEEDDEDDDPIVPTGETVDITALVREAGKATATLEQGVAYSASCGAEHVFDGDNAPQVAAGRFMGDAPGGVKPTAEKPMVIRYDIGSDFESGKKIVLSSMKIIIGGESWGVDRSPTKFALYGVKGDQETKLYECTADPGWQDNNRTMEFPFENGRSFRSYRLKIFSNKSAGSSPYISMTEAIFYGCLVESAEPVPPEDPSVLPVYTLTIPEKTGLNIESVKTNDVAVAGADGAYSIVSNTAVTITFDATEDYEIISGNPVVVTITTDKTLADNEYPVVRQKVTPPAPGDVILPGETASATRQTIQSAIDAAAPTQGTVTLGEGLFDINAELFVTNGVTLAGQGRDKTIVRQTNAMKSNAEHRVMTVADGSTVCELTITGGNNDKNYGCGGGVVITAGTISGCCVTNNFSRRYFGGGIYVGEGGNVKIDHTILSDNSAGTGGLDGAGGGIGIRGKSGAQVVIEACLVYGNTAGGTGRTSPGGGIAVTDKNNGTVVIRNTTVANNEVVGSGICGGIYVGNGSAALVNCLVAGNTSETAAAYGDANVASKTEKLAPATTTCLVGGTPGFVGSGDYHLAEGSAAIGAGTAWEGIGNDLDGKAFATVPSIGCYEYGSVPVTVLPTYIQGKPQDVVVKYNDWAAINGADTASAFEESFLLNCGTSAADLEAAKAAFAITAISFNSESGKWECEVTGEKGEGDEYGNGYVHFISVKERFGLGENGDAFKATLEFAP